MVVMAAENDQQVTWTQRNPTGEPAYVLIVHSSDLTCSKGDEFTMDIYISGAGNVDLAKLYVSIPSYIPETIKIRPDGMRENVKLTYLEPTEITSKKVNNEASEEFLPSVFDLTLPSYFFKHKFLDNDPTHLGVQGERIQLDPRYGKKSYHAPISFSFSIAKYAPPGDHNIYLHLVYKDGSKWYSNSTVLKIHIKQWYENDGTRFLVMLAAIASVISGLWALCNCFNGIPTTVTPISTIIVPIIIILGLWFFYIFIDRN